MGTAYLFQRRGATDAADAGERLERCHGDVAVPDDGAKGFTKKAPSTVTK